MIWRSLRTFPSIGAVTGHHLNAEQESLLSHVKPGFRISVYLQARNAARLVNKRCQDHWMPGNQSPFAACLRAKFKANGAYRTGVSRTITPSRPTGKLATGVVDTCQIDVAFFRNLNHRHADGDIA